MKRGKREEFLLLSAIFITCFIQTSKCEERNAPVKAPPPTLNFPVCGNKQIGPPNYFQHTGLSFNYRLFISLEESFLAIYSEGFHCSIKFYLNISNINDKNSPNYDKECYLEPVEGSNFCCVSNSTKHPNYGTKCFDSFDRKYLLQIPDTSDVNNENDNHGFIFYIYVDDFFYEATTEDKFYNYFYDDFYYNLYYTNDRLKGSNYLDHYSQWRWSFYYGLNTSAIFSVIEDPIVIDYLNNSSNSTSYWISSFWITSNSSHSYFSFVLFFVSNFLIIFLHF